MSEAAFRFCDDLGPVKVVHVHDPRIGLKAIVVIDNVACGPSIGGVRMAPAASTEECFRLARAMTLKNAAAALPHGGGKSVILGDPAMPEAEKEQLIRCFGHAIRGLEDYIPGPDMGTNERCMAWMADEIGRAVGLPAEIGGIPLDEIGATGLGVAICAEVAHELAGLSLAGSRVAIQGFGAVGRHTARFLAARGAVVVALSDSGGAVHNRDGIDLDLALGLKGAGQSVADATLGEVLSGDDLIGVDCDVWIPAARPDAIRAENVDRLKAKLVVSGANIPVTADAEETLHQRGVVVVPDFIANAGGVICAAVEYRGGTERAALQMIEEKVRSNSRQVLETARREALAPRAAAVALAERRVRAAMEVRRWL